MTNKPVFDPNAGANQQDWDAAYNDALSGLYGGALPDQNPMPIPETTAALPAAANWQRCMIWWNDSGTWKLMASDGTTWQQIVF